MTTAHLDLTTDGTQRLLDALAAMNETAPNAWWQYVPCETCQTQPGSQCVQGYDGWPNPARQPHRARHRSARVLWSTLYQLTRGTR